LLLSTGCGVCGPLVDGPWVQRMVSSLVLLILFTISTATATTAKNQRRLDDKPIFGPYMHQSNTTITLPSLDSSDRRVILHFPIDPATNASYLNKSFPLISYAHGLDNEVTDYTRLFAGIVSFGYIIAAHHACKEGCHDDPLSLRYDPPGFGNYYQQQLKVIDWLMSNASSKTSLPCTIDLTNGVAIAGHSMGGQSTLFSSSYDNASMHNISAAAMHHAFTHEYAAPAIPFLAFTGGEDVVAFPSMTEKYYKAKGTHTVSSKGIIYKSNADHFEPEDPFFPVYYSYNPLVAQFTAAWFKIHLEKKNMEFGINFYDMIYGNLTSSVCHGGDGGMTKCEML
jgi:hypothetical protein